MTKRTENKLTDAAIRAAVTGDDGRDRWLADGNALWVRVRGQASRKTFVYRPKVSGRIKPETLGTWPELSLKEARAQVRARREQGKPAADSASDMTLAQAVDRYRPTLRHTMKRAADAEAYLDKKLVPYLGASVPLRDITRRQIANLYEQVRESTPVAANRLRTETQKFFTHAFVKQWTDDNPAAGIPRTMAGGKERSRERVLTDDEIRALWNTDHLYGDVLRLLLLTGQRAGEARQMKWEHVDFEAGTWTIPAELAKNGRAHTVVLSEPALAIIKRQPLKRELVFYGITAPISATTLPTWLKKQFCPAHELEPFTTHDLRRTFATMANEHACAQPHIVDRCLNHARKGVEGRYNRAPYKDECKAAWTTWAETLQRIIGADLV